MTTINTIGTPKITLANTLTTAGNFPLTLTASNTTNATLPAGSTTLVPTTGTGATGTWGINISGNAGTASTVTTNANLTGDVTSVGNAATVVTNANLTGPVTSVGNATTIAPTPGFSAQLSNSTDTSNVTGDGTDYILAGYTDLLFDTLNNFDGTTGLFTAPVDGIYSFSGKVWIYNTLFNTFNTMYVGFSVSGTGHLSFILNPYAIMDAGTNTMVNCNEIFKLTAGDTVCLYVRVSNDTKTVNVQGNSTFSGKYLSAT